VLFIVDEDVPKSASDLLIEREHEVAFVLQEFMPESKDYLIARWAHERAAVVVTCNVRHFRPFMSRPTYTQAGLLGLPQLQARDRLERYWRLRERAAAGYGWRYAPQTPWSTAKTLGEHSVSIAGLCSELGSGFVFKKWCARQESNLLPCGPEPHALSGELRARIRPPSVSAGIRAALAAPGAVRQAAPDINRPFP
jgi:hypothetical protein